METRPAYVFDQDRMAGKRMLSLRRNGIVFDSMYNRREA